MVPVNFLPTLYMLDFFRKHKVFAFSIISWHKMTPVVVKPCSGTTLVEVNSGNVLLPDSTMPLPESILTSHQWGPVIIAWEQFHEIPQPSIAKIGLKMAYLRFHSILPGANELTLISKYPRLSTTRKIFRHIFYWNICALVEDHDISIANALEILQSFTDAEPWHSIVLGLGYTSMCISVSAIILIIYPVHVYHMVTFVLKNPVDILFWSH